MYLYKKLSTCNHFHLNFNLFTKLNLTDSLYFYVNGINIKYMQINVKEMQVGVQDFGRMVDTNQAQDGQNTEAEFVFLNVIFFFKIEIHYISTALSLTAFLNKNK